MDKILENEIKHFMAAKLADGITLSEIQSLVNAEFKQNMTYMDIRIMASELEVDWKKFDPEKKVEAPAEAGAAPAENVAPAEADSAEDAAPAENTAAAPEMPDLSDTVIEVSKIARPGMMFSGSVTFANGATAEWFLDNMGRLGLDDLQGENPSEEDVRKFQIALQLELRKLMGR
ncbi:MAG: hypothetical protein IKC89_01535 [Lentisphaeria bacterium]|nr:hypothetical protein [Lentisphaeria bacterium]